MKYGLILRRCIRDWKWLIVNFDFQLYTNFPRYPIFSLIKSLSWRRWDGAQRFFQGKAKVMGSKSDSPCCNECTSLNFSVTFIMYGSCGLLTNPFALKSNLNHALISPFLIHRTVKTKFYFGNLQFVHYFSKFNKRPNEYTLHGLWQ